LRQADPSVEVGKRADHRGQTRELDAFLRFDIELLKIDRAAQRKVWK